MLKLPETKKVYRLSPTPHRLKRGQWFHNRRSDGKRQVFLRCRCGLISDISRVDPLTYYADIYPGNAIGYINDCWSCRGCRASFTGSALFGWSPLFAVKSRTPARALEALDRELRTTKVAVMLTMPVRKSGYGRQQDGIIWSVYAAGLQGINLSREDGYDGQPTVPYYTVRDYNNHVRAQPSSLDEAAKVMVELVNTPLIPVASSH